MRRKFFSKVLYGWMKWQVVKTVPEVRRSIICVAPHTSNWDFVIAILYKWSTGLHSYFLMKSSWFFFPLGALLKSIGGIPIDRSRHGHLTDYLAELLSRHSDMHIAITPEGTRSVNPRWKKGFYFIAQKASVPIQLYGIDFPGKRIVCTKQIVPCGNLEKDMREISDYYRQFKDTGLKPEKFALDEGD